MMSRKHLSPAERHKAHKAKVDAELRASIESVRPRVDPAIHALSEARLAVDRAEANARIALYRSEIARRATKAQETSNGAIQRAKRVLEALEGKR